jgi:undecaprenyl-diphosphatase
MTRFMKFITFWGSGWALTIISLVISFIAFIRSKKKYFLSSLLVSVNLAAASSLDFILKQVFQRSRPDLLRLIEISGYSFPSGHSMSSISFYGFLIYLSLKYFKQWFKYSIVAALSLLVLAIGISRIYLGVHYASDVLGGFITGLGWLVLFIRFSRKALV